MVEWTQWIKLMVNSCLDGIVDLYDFMWSVLTKLMILLSLQTCVGTRDSPTFNGDF